MGKSQWQAVANRTATQSQDSSDGCDANSSYTRTVKSPSRSTYVADAVMWSGVAVPERNNPSNHSCAT